MTLRGFHAAAILVFLCGLVQPIGLAHAQDTAAPNTAQLDAINLRLTRIETLLPVLQSQFAAMAAAQQQYLSRLDKFQDRLIKNEDAVSDTKSHLIDEILTTVGIIIAVMIGAGGFIYFQIKKRLTRRVIPKRVNNEILKQVGPASQQTRADMLVLLAQQCYDRYECRYVSFLEGHFQASELLKSDITMARQLAEAGLGEVTGKKLQNKIRQLYTLQRRAT